MYSNYYQEHSLFIDSVSKYCKAELGPKIDQWEKEGNFPDEVFKDLGEQGFLGLLIPEQYGGSGADYKMAAAWCETFGEVPAVGLTVGVNMHSLVVSHALAQYGSKQACEKWLPAAVSGDAIGAYAFSEPGAGSDLSSLRTKAEKKGDKWILNGSKTFITNGERAHFILVLARHDFDAGYKGFTTFVVDTSKPGFSVTRKLDKLGWRSSDTAEFSMENLEVEPEYVLGEVGQGWSQAASNLNWERMMLTLTSLGGARACLRDSIRYAKERQAFGKTLIEIDSVRSLLKTMYSKLVRAEAICRHAVELVHTAQDCSTEVSAAKKLVCDDAVWIADRAIQIHGGYGYTSEFSPERWWRDLRLMPIGGGTSEIMANIAAKRLGYTYH